MPGSPLPLLPFDLARNPSNRKLEPPAFPKAKELLNKPIPHFDDLRIICGDDHATGEFARTIFHQFGSENTKEEGAGAGAGVDMETEPSENNNNNNNNEGETARTSTTNNAQKRRRASRVNSEGTSVDPMCNKFDRLATSIDNSSKDWKEKMSDALWSMEGYDDDELEIVYLALRGNRDLAEDFYMRKPSLRKKFVDQFIADRSIYDY
ncbi:hypothetical protein J5N97_003887 [Dioscorea zingiberensis]|uniref:Uncharacterized protein n=1 Tax=Dioscorea zingiberensis TaxID=325984 RepID=A0A9D5HR39_9LILI|nr:hypothetical protein J5N97_003887 [Dioscorea zingiberensis]